MYVYLGVSVASAYASLKKTSRKHLLNSYFLSIYCNDLIT